MRYPIAPTPSNLETDCLLDLISLLGLLGLLGLLCHLDSFHFRADPLLDFGNAWVVGVLGSVFERVLEDCIDGTGVRLRISRLLGALWLSRVVDHRVGKPEDVFDWGSTGC